MAVAVIMPRQGQSVESCIITKWYKKVGDKIEVGDKLFDYETDKASFDEEAKEAGVLLAIIGKEGDDIPCLDNVAVIGAEGEDISAFLTVAPAQENAPVEAAKAEVKAAPIAATGEVKAGERVKISPRAKGEAENMGLDFTKATPTGPNGRIIERDIIALSKTAPAEFDTDMMQKVAVATGEAKAMDASAAEFEDVALPHIRKVIAKSMHDSLSNMAQLTHSFSFDATNIMAYRKSLKASAEEMGLANITLNDMIIYAVSRTILNHKDLNAHYLDDRMRYFKNVNIGMAVDTPRGLLVPTIFCANKLSLNEIAAETKKIAREAQEGSISPDKLTGASFTISNLGAFGVEHFTPVINPPQTGILGVNNIQTRLKMVGGEAVPYQAMGLSLTYDHRALDGAPASRFVQELCKMLESFTVLLAK